MISDDEENDNFTTNALFVKQPFLVYALFKDSDGSYYIPAKGVVLKRTSDCIASVRHPGIRVCQWIDGSGDCSKLVVVTTRRVNEFRQSDEWRVLINQSKCSFDLSTSFLNKIIMFGYESCTPTLVYVISEFCPGTDLLNCIVERGHAPPENEAVDILYQIAQGILQLKHVCGVAHMDLSLENVIISHEGHCRLIDFEFATVLAESSELKGKFNYIAPEVYALKHESSRSNVYNPYAADVWSFGVVAYALLTFSCLYASPEDRIVRRIYMGNCSLGQIMEKQRRASFRRQCWDLLSNEAKGFLEWILQGNPLKRPSIEMICEHPWFGDKKNK